MGTYRDFHRRSIEDRDAFWRAEAGLVDWHRPFDKVLDYSRPPFARWFVGGETNLCHNARDRHLAARGGQKALVYISTETGQEKSYTYRELFAEVNRCAAMIRSLGVGKGDRVLIYMPMVPEAVFAMLACARLGAIHSVVFGGFASHSLAARIDDARPKLMITADGGMRGGRAILYRTMYDEAIRLSKSPPASVIIYNRGLDKDLKLAPGRDLDYDPALREKHLNEQVRSPGRVERAVLHSYTSGTTGHPKGVQRDTGGTRWRSTHPIKHITAREPGETMFTTSDIGWVVGHSYIVYGPLICGMTTIL